MNDLSIPYVYAISNGKHIKLGVAKNPFKRIKQLSTGSSEKLILLGYFNGGFTKEKELHKQYKKVRENGEWFYPTEDLISFLNDNIQDKFITVDNEKVIFHLKLKL